MSYRGFLLALTLVVFSGSRADAQGLCSTTAQGKVACTITNVFGVNGLTPDGGALVNDGHKGHFGDDFLTNLGPLNASIGSQLGQLPLVSPASGLSFSSASREAWWHLTSTLGLFLPSAPEPSDGTS